MMRVAMNGRRRLMAVLAGLLVSVTAGAGGDGRAADALLKTLLEDTQTLRADFEQTLVTAEGELAETTRGTLEIARPGRFRWIYSEPYEQWLVADGLNVWNYDLDLEQVAVKPQAEALASTPAMLLGGGADALEEFAVDDEYAADGLHWVRLQPLDTNNGFRRVDLGFDDGVLAAMRFIDNLEQTTRVNLDDVRINEPLADEHFRFVPPDGVDVVGTPVVAESGVD